MNNFQETRRQGIGASDVSAILGLSKYNTPLDVYLAKVEGISIQSNKYMEAGKRQEDLTAKWFVEKYNQDNQESCAISSLKAFNLNYIECDKDLIYKHKGWDFLRASPDRLLAFFDIDLHFTEFGLLECKFTQRDVEVAVPEHYIQLQWQLFILNLPFGYLAYNIKGLDLIYYRFEYNQDLINTILPKIISFWNENVLVKAAPEPVNEADLNYLYPKSLTDSVIQADDRDYEEYKSLMKIKESINNLKSEQDSIETRIKLKLKENENMLYGEKRLFSYITHTKNTLDSKSIQSNFPDIYSKNLKETMYRQFLLKV